MSDTSTFTIHHDRCDPSKWTVAEWSLLAKFMKYRALQDAAALSRLGMQLALSDHHVPTGGTLEEVGFSEPKTFEFTEDMSEIHDGSEITEIRRVYLGPVEYAVAIPMDDGDGNFEGYEFEFKDSEAEAQEYVKEMHKEAAE
ncbi:MAG: hypothetical protein JZU55_02620 [Afipia sp.]|nr:hypothetical protein [Afipia sp.]